MDEGHVVPSGVFLQQSISARPYAQDATFSYRGDAEEGAQARNIGNLTT